MGYKHTPEQILEAAVETAIGEGLHRLTFGRVAQRLGVNDRTVVYYFPTKERLVEAVLAELGRELQETVLAALPDKARDHIALVRAAAPHLMRSDMDRRFALYFEASGLASAHVEPYRTLAPVLVESWAAWFGERLAGSPERRRAEALAAIALLDGLLLLRQLAEPEVATQAARALGVQLGVQG